jgi:O-methyltransferase involved in polyketide biosynthesis
MAEKITFNLSGVPETLLIPLYTRAVESRRPDAILSDPQAAEIVSRIDYDFARVKLEGHDEVAILIRAREFDRHTRQFLARNPGAGVVHIGCGLDTRFERVDDGKVEWFDLDLPEVIALRRQLIGGEGSPRYHLLSGSAFEDAWLDTVAPNGQQRPFLFLAEGVFPYFEEAQIKALVLKLRERFPGSELVCDAHTPFVIWSDNLQMALKHLSARLRWKLSHPRDLEAWAPGIRLLEAWYYFDQPEPRLGSLKWMRHFPFMAKSTGIFHYCLG